MKLTNACRPIRKDKIIHELFIANATCINIVTDTKKCMFLLSVLYLHREEDSSSSHSHPTAAMREDSVLFHQQH